MKKLILPLFLGTLLFSSCGSKTETKSAFNLDSAKNEIEAWNVNFETVVKNKDSVGFSNLYAENAVRMAPNTAEIQGRANILKSVVEPFKVIGSTNLTMIDAWGDENTITTTGTYEHFLADGKSVEKGKYMGVLKRVDGKLVSSRDIWNSNDAVPAIGK